MKWGFSKGNLHIYEKRISLLYQECPFCLHISSLIFMMFVNKKNGGFELRKGENLFKLEGNLHFRLFKGHSLGEKPNVFILCFLVFVFVRTPHTSSLPLTNLLQDSLSRLLRLSRVGPIHFSLMILGLYQDREIWECNLH
jgi:hypothetical protein